jgi:hypothetical protein
MKNGAHGSWNLVLHSATFTVKVAGADWRARVGLTSFYLLRLSTVSYGQEARRLECTKRYEDPPSTVSRAHEHPLFSFPPPSISGIELKAISLNLFWSIEPVVHLPTESDQAPASQTGQMAAASTNQRGNATGSCSSVETDCGLDEEDSNPSPVTGNALTGSDPDQEVVQE